MGSFNGQTVAIIGARGIGEAIADRCSKEGANLVLTYYEHADRLEKVAEKATELGVNVLSLQFDITKAEDVDRLVAETTQRFGKADVLVLSAAGGLEPGKEDDLEWPFVINCDAQVSLAKQASRHWPGIKIIYLTSLWAHCYGQVQMLPGYGSVAASKNAGEAVLRTLDPTYSRVGIVCAHIVARTMVEGLFRRRVRQLHAELQATTPTGSFPSTEEVANAVIELASEKFAPGKTVYVGGDGSALPMLHDVSLGRTEIAQMLPMYGEDALYLDAFEYNRKAKGAPARGMATLRIAEERCEGHFRDPYGKIFPAHKLMEAAAQGIGMLWLQTHIGTEEFVGMYKRLGEASFEKPALPGDILRLEVKLMHECFSHFTGSCMVYNNSSGELVASIERVQLAMVPRGIAERMLRRS